jgi:hypothetical protein
MKYLTLLLSTIIAFVIISCGNENKNPVESLGDQSNRNNFDSGLLKQNYNFNAHLNGDGEVPPVNTNAQGQVTFKLSSDGNSIYYKLIAANIENILMAHIHLAPAGTNGGIVVWLYPDAAPPQLIPGSFNGVLAEGTITDSNLVGALEGMTIEDLINEFLNNNAYVNVHTTQNPGGEIRGQIK